MESPGDSDHCWNDDSWEWILYPFPFQLHFGGWICWSIFHLFSIYGKSLILRWMGWSFILHPALDWKLWHWLVVWNIFPYIGNNNHPNWLSYFQRGRYTTNQDTKQIPGGPKQRVGAKESWEKPVRDVAAICLKPAIQLIHVGMAESDIWDITQVAMAIGSKKWQA